MAAIGKTALSSTYQKKTQKEHIKDAPDTYVGAIEPDNVKNWSFNNDNSFNISQLYLDTWDCIKYLMRPL